jgi:hypothetical protein
LVDSILADQIFGRKLFGLLVLGLDLLVDGLQMGLDPGSEFSRLSPQLIVTQELIAGKKMVDLTHQWFDLADVLFGLAAAE